MGEITDEYIKVLYCPKCKYWTTSQADLEEHLLLKECKNGKKRN